MTMLTGKLRNLWGKSSGRYVEATPPHVLKPPIHVTVVRNVRACFIFAKMQFSRNSRLPIAQLHYMDIFRNECMNSTKFNRAG